MQKIKISYQHIDPKSDLIQFLERREKSKKGFGSYHLCGSVFLINHSVGVPSWAYIFQYGEVQDFRLSIEDVIERPDLEPEVRLQLLFNLDLFVRNN